MIMSRFTSTPWRWQDAQRVSCRTPEMTSTLAGGSVMWGRHLRDHRSQSQNLRRTRTTCPRYCRSWIKSTSKPQWSQERGEKANINDQSWLMVAMKTIDFVISLIFMFISWADAGWRVFFNKLGNFNWLGKVRKTKLYHNTESVINR